MTCSDCDRQDLVAGQDLACGMAVSIDPATGKLVARRPGPGPHYWQLVSDVQAGDQLEPNGIGNYLRKRKEVTR